MNGRNCAFQVCECALCACVQKPSEPTQTTHLLGGRRSKPVTSEYVPSYARAPEAPAPDIPVQSARQHRPDLVKENKSDFRESLLVHLICNLPVIEKFTSFKCLICSFCSFKNCSLSFKIYNMCH